VKANGEFISTIMVLRDEMVFDRSVTMQHAALGARPMFSNEFTPGRRQSSSQLKK
jgi:hypothetical protein